MTNEEAIELLCAYGVPLDEEKFCEALDMAIKALGAEQTDGDLISRQAVITMLNKIENAVEDGDGFQFNEWIYYAKHIPSAEKTAEWIDLGFKEEEYGQFGECSNCGVETLLGSNYCPNCGRRMKEVE